MAKVLRCREVGMDCDFEARGETVEEILEKAAPHAKQAHNLDKIPPEVEQKILSAIHEE